MTPVERRLRALEATVGTVGDTSFNSLVAQAHAQGRRVRNITVDVGESVEAVLEREGVHPDEPVIVRQMVAPQVVGNGTDASE